MTVSTSMKLKQLMPADVSLTTIAAVAAVTAIAWMMTKKESSKTNLRRWSSMSDSLAQGTFPPESKFDEAIINVVMVMDDADRPTVDEIVNKCVQLLLQYERFSSIYDRKTSCSRHGGGGGGDSLDPYDLVREIPVQDCCLDTDLLKVMEDLATVPLAEAPRGIMLPWWEFVLLKNTNTTNKPGGKSAVVWRIHHSLGDGISLVKVVQELFLNAKTLKPLSSDLSAGNPNLQKKFRVKRSPFQWISHSISALANVVPLPIGRFDDLTLLRKGEINKDAKFVDPKTLAFPDQQAIIPFVPIPLDFIKTLKRAASGESNKNVTVNDILFTVISQAIYEFLKEEKDPTLESKKEKLLCRTLLPIALPRPFTNDKSRALRNLWCFISCDLSIGINDPIQRLWTIHESLADLKRGLVPMVSSLLSTLVMQLPRLISRDQTLQLFARHSMVLSNVPGPPEPASFAGHEVHAVHMIHMNIIPQLSFLSYRGMVFGNAIIGGPNDDAIAKRRQDRLPLHVSNALVKLASELHVPNVPEDIRTHAAQL